MGLERDLAVGWRPRSTAQAARTRPRRGSPSRSIVIDSGPSRPDDESLSKIYAQQGRR